MPAYFVVRRRVGPAWIAGLSMQSQPLWAEHVAFMNMLEAEGFIVLGGPIGSGEEALLIIEAANEEAVVARLALDPWTEAQLRIDTIERWTILLDSRARKSMRSIVIVDIGARFAERQQRGGVADGHPRRSTIGD